MSKGTDRKRFTSVSNGMVLPLLGGLPFIYWHFRGIKISDLGLKLKPDADDLPDLDRIDFELRVQDSLQVAPERQSERGGEDGGHLPWH